MSAAVEVFMGPHSRTTIVSTASGWDREGCECHIDPADPYMPMVRRFSTFPEALSFATAHAATHTCPSWRASGERCTDICTDCGGRGWVA